jgi:hypothetical protein
MSSDEAQREIRQELFGSFADNRNDNSSRRRLIIIAICAAFVVIAGFFATKFLPKPSPYNELVGRLYPGMSYDWLIKALGEPYYISSNDPVPGQDRLIYRVNGTKLPLIIQFNGYDNRTTNWCEYVPGRSQLGGEVFVFLPTNMSQSDIAFEKGLISTSRFMLTPVQPTRAGINRDGVALNILQSVRGDGPPIAGMVGVELGEVNVKLACHKLE